VLFHATLTRGKTHTDTRLPFTADTSPVGTHSDGTYPPTLPSLFAIPSLRHLAIHNTALGDPLFASVQSGRPLPARDPRAWRV
jgi:hypothetical protein